MPLTPRDIKALKSKEEAVSLLKRNGITVYSDVTHFDSLTNTFVTNYTWYLEEVKKSTGTKAKNAVVANMIKDIVGRCGPVAAQLRFLGKDFVKECVDHFKKDKDADILKTTIKSYKNKYEDPKPEWLAAYKDSVTAFRKMMREKNYEGPESLWMQQAVQAELKVGTATADILAMLTRMKELRAKQLGGTVSGCAHLEEAVTALQADLSMPLITSWKKGVLTERADVGGAYKYDEGTGKYGPDEEGKMLLLSSAICAMNQNPIKLHKDILKKLSTFVTDKKDTTNTAEKQNWEIISRAMAEGEALFTGATLLKEGAGAGKYSSQMMNIDPLWFTFFVCTKIAEVTSADDFYRWQRGIYGACTAYRGRAHMESLFTTFETSGLPGYDKMKAANSVAKDIHLPPWIFTYARTYDIAACIAPLDIQNPDGTIQKPAISWRYFLCLNFEKKKEAISFITSLWNVEGLANAGETEDIRISERILHQVIMGRNSPLANTNMITGNALNVKIVE
ncbi:nucleocapsid protein [Xinzhou Spider Virus]|uniref:Nucleocapsid protein n=1 Tax=Xinzhou Spider Virus TaxID=1608143 RepID=A0A0B5KY75_9VIRU|nr:nucleocapsid protein [Xinzhou Spider Virus]AJG39333.1 nucleocapsid protein [Xinzhou Spider Virus]